jgi:epoxyqueuosine reductase
MDDLTAEIKALARGMGAHLVGIASTDRFIGAPKGHHPQDLMPEARSVIVIALPFYQSVLGADTLGLTSTLLPRGHDPGHLGYVQEHMYEFLYDANHWRLNGMAAELANVLTTRHYGALPLDSGKGFAFHLQRLRALHGDTSGFPGERYSFFSHRHAGVLAGLGDLGPNNLLITEKYGPRVSLNSVITTAELEPDPMSAPVCPGEACLLCIRPRTCFGEIKPLAIGGREYPIATFKGCKPGLTPADTDVPDVCRRGGWGTLPYLRYCVGICPMGRR